MLCSETAIEGFDEIARSGTSQVVCRSIGLNAGGKRIQVVSVVQQSSRSRHT